MRLYLRDPYTEEDAQRIASSLFSALSYLHYKGIVHRDLKHENIMFASPTSPDVKVIDFGLSKKYASGEHLRDAVGTVYTMAPELLAGDYGPKIDVWSLGVITFMLLSSSMPFYGKDRAHVIKKIVHGKFHFSSRRWKQVSQDAKIFVKTVLDNNPLTRPTAEQALSHSWMNRSFDSRGLAPEVDYMDHVQASLQTFGGYVKLKKMALMIIGKCLCVVSNICALYRGLI